MSHGSAAQRPVRLVERDVNAFERSTLLWNKATFFILGVTFERSGMPLHGRLPLFLRQLTIASVPDSKVASELPTTRK